MKQIHPARAPLHKEGDQRGVGLGRVAVTASEHQVVRTIICRLTPAGPDVVQGNGVFAGFVAAICANRPVLGQQPIAVRLHGTTGGTTETRDGNCGMSSRSACHKEPSKGLNLDLQAGRLTTPEKPSKNDAKLTARGGLTYGPADLFSTSGASARYRPSTRRPHRRS